jgi:hypothetical protein
MKLKISQIRSAQDDEWDSIWQACGYSTYFHSREWAEIWHCWTNGDMCPAPRLVCFSDGKRALLPLSFGRHFKGLIKQYISSPAGTFGGWISADDLGDEHAVLLGRYLIHQLGNLVWRLNPYDERVFAVELPEGRKDETQVLDLADGFDAIFKRWTKGHRSAVRQAQKAGVSVKLASTPEDWQLYYQVYENSLRRWRDKASSRYGWEIFQHMFQKKSPQIKLWLAIYQDTVVAGALCFYAKKHVVYWHGAALKEFFNFRPVNLLLWEIIKNACEMGYQWFDLNPSGGHEGVRKFKKSFGAQEMSCPLITTTSRMYRVLSLIARLKHR